MIKTLLEKFYRKNKVLVTTNNRNNFKVSSVNRDTMLYSWMREFEKIRNEKQRSLK